MTQALCWDPEKYAVYAAERQQPFSDLLSRLSHLAPRRILDLGCGQGQLTLLLAQRWPEAEVTGIDHSPEMVERARAITSGSAIHIFQADLRSWSFDPPYDLVLSNAVLHWVPDHLPLLVTILRGMSRSGCLAFQVPANFDQPSYRAMAQLLEQAAYAPWQPQIQPSSHELSCYLAELLHWSERIEAWETTYYHILSGDHAVRRWLEGTSLRPLLSTMPSVVMERFMHDLDKELINAYPPHEGRVIFPFRRRFVVAQR